MDRWGRRSGMETLHVLPGHREPLQAYARRLARFGPWYLPAMACCLLLMMVAAVALGLAGLGIGTLLLGLLILAFPCATPETVWMLGIRRSVLLARSVAVALIAIGIALVFVAP